MDYNHNTPKQEDKNHESKKNHAGYKIPVSDHYSSKLLRCTKYAVHGRPRSIYRWCVRLER